MTAQHTVPAPQQAAADDWPAGWRINPRNATVDDATIARFKDVPVAVMGDCLGRITGARGLDAYHGPAPMAGRALTVRVRPGDNLMVHKAILMSQPGDVIVIDGGGDLSQAVIGGLMRTSALAAGVAGFVIDGALRDVDEWAEGGMPVFAAGKTFRGPTKEGPGEINVPVAVGGLVVNPGDLVVGDSDGVIAVAPERLDSLYAACTEHLKKEAGIREKNASGVKDNERFDAILRAKGLPV